MPLQNRVDPWGKLHAVNYRGNWMGNRGILHNQKKQIVSQWRHKSWVTCELNFKDHQRDIFALNSYSELFFLDEATALAAGHRPCAECRRDRYKEFKKLWFIANPQFGSETSAIAVLDKQLHAERVDRVKNKVTFVTSVSSLPDGTIFEREGSAYLICNGQFFLWSFDGYQKSSLILSMNESVAVLTPASIVAIFRLGFRPQTHSSADCKQGERMSV